MKTKSDDPSGLVAETLWPKEKQTFHHEGREEHEARNYKVYISFVSFVCFVVSAAWEVLHAR